VGGGGGVVWGGGGWGWVGWVWGAGGGGGGFLGGGGGGGKGVVFCGFVGGWGVFGGGGGGGGGGFLGGLCWGFLGGFLGSGVFLFVGFLGGGGGGFFFWGGGGFFFLFLGGWLFLGVFFGGWCFLWGCDIFFGGGGGGFLGGGGGVVFPLFLSYAIFSWGKRRQEHFFKRGGRIADPPFSSHLQSEAVAFIDLEKGREAISGEGKRTIIPECLRGKKELGRGQKKGEKHIMPADAPALLQKRERERFCRKRACLLKAMPCLAEEERGRVEHLIKCWRAKYPSEPMVCAFIGDEGRGGGSTQPSLERKE